MGPRALIRVAISWLLALQHTLPGATAPAGDTTATSRVPTAATTANEGGLPSSEKGYPKLTPTSIYEIFWESFRLQASVGDLLSSANGFNTIARARRGQPWPGRNAPDVSCSIGTKPEGMGGMNVVHRGRNESTNCLDVFFGAREDTVQEFASRSSANLADVSNGNFILPATWGADVFSPLIRGNNFITALHKLDHDREQLEYLIEKRRLPQEFKALADDYNVVREWMAAAMAKTITGEPKRAFRGNYYAFGLESFVRLRGAYNSLLHVPPGPAERGLGGSHPTGFRRALNQNLDWEAIENEYLSKELPLLWFDGFLSPEALDGVLQFCREATVFFDVKIGYLGAYFNDGLSSPWLIQIVNELQERLPRVLEGMTLSNMWAYKFDSDSSMDGITVHADSASINLNFWVTPDDANLDPSSGGLVVYPKEPPNRGASEPKPNMVDTAMWNDFSQKSSIKRWLKEEGVYDLAVTVPYRQNRIVMFDSRLLHETDAFSFRQGYENRRINLTFLFSPAEVL